jgi:hypothetical protein
LLLFFASLAACGQPDTFPAATLRSPLPPVELPAVMSVTNPTGPVITPQQAGAIVRAFWPLNERAKATNDQRLTDMLESGPAAEFDDAVSLDNLQRPHLPNLRVVRPLNGLEVFVPLQASFPAYFLADVLTTVYGTSPEGDPPGTVSVEVYVFVRPDAGHPWRAGLRTFGPTRLGVITNPREPSYLPTLTASRNLTVDPRTVPALLAAYWQQYYITGAPPASIFAPGRWTTEKMQALLKTMRQFAADTGIKERTEYFADPRRDGLYEFAVNGGWDLTCFTVRYATVQTRPGGRALHQDPGRDNYGGWLAPGDYQQITTTGLRQTCAWVSPVGSQGAGVLVMGHEGGDLLSTGVPTRTSG